MTRPRIAVPLPTSFDAQYNHVNWPAYAEAVRAAGGEPIALSLEPGERLRLDALDGILLPGSPADVDPASYGHLREPGTARPDPARESIDRLLLEHAERTAKPLLAICFGLQMLNVFYGGTLLQDVGSLPVNHSAGASVAVAHSVVLQAGTRLAQLLSLDEGGESGPGLRLQINSSHHQAVGMVGQGLVVSGRCPQDVVVEAIELAPESTGAARFLLGVQWHPERSVDVSATSRAMFAQLIAEARMRTDREQSQMESGA